jgi:hypothetical protein
MSDRSPQLERFIVGLEQKTAALKVEPQPEEISEELGRVLFSALRAAVSYEGQLIPLSDKALQEAIQNVEQGTIGRNIQARQERLVTLESYLATQEETPENMFYVYIVDVLIAEFSSSIITEPPLIH